MGTWYFVVCWKDEIYKWVIIIIIWLWALYETLKRYILKIIANIKYWTL